MVASSTCKQESNHNQPFQSLCQVGAIANKRLHWWGEQGVLDGLLNHPRGSDSWSLEKGKRSPKVRMIRMIKGMTWPGSLSKKSHMFKLIQYVDEPLEAFIIRKDDAHSCPRCIEKTGSAIRNKDKREAPWYKACCACSMTLAAVISKVCRD